MSERDEAEASREAYEPEQPLDEEPRGSRRGGGPAPLKEATQRILDAARERVREAPPPHVPDLEAVKRAALQGSAFIERLLRAGVPPRHLKRCDVDLLGPIASPLEDFLLGCAAGSGPMLALLGPTGTGKSYAACWALAEYLRRSARVKGGELWGDPHKVQFRDARVVTCFEIYEAVFDRDRDRFHTFGLLDFLVIEDVGAAYEHDFPKAALDRLIDLRWGAMRPTILTSNLRPTAPPKPQEWQENLEDLLPRSFSRLAEPGPGVVVLDREDLRRRAR